MDTSPAQASQPFSPAPSASHTAFIAIIIDDIGYRAREGKLAVQLPGAVTLSVLPHSPHGARLAEAAHQAEKEVMLHAPMSNVQGKPLDEGALTGDMDRLAFVATLVDGLQSVPHVQGLNNHMGSLLTQNVTAMQWLMAELEQRQLYFVDSRTSAQSRGLEVARRYGIRTLERDYFLDNQADHDSIQRQFEHFIAMAKRRGYGVAIGHPYPETLQFLAEALPKLSARGIQLLPVSSLLSQAQGVNETSQKSRYRPADGAFHHVERLHPR